MARFTIFIPDDLAARMDSVKPDDVPRSKWIRRAIERTLTAVEQGPRDPVYSRQEQVEQIKRAEAKAEPPKAPSKPKAQPEPLDHLKSSGLLQPAKYVKRFNPQPKK